jgi:hypothetical protein
MSILVGQDVQIAMFNQPNPITGKVIGPVTKIVKDPEIEGSVVECYPVQLSEGFYSESGHLFVRVLLVEKTNITVVQPTSLHQGA